MFAMLAAVALAARARNLTATAAGVATRCTVQTRRPEFVRATVSRNLTAGQAQQQAGDQQIPPIHFRLP
jgi:hypothetical protein